MEKVIKTIKKDGINVQLIESAPDYIYVGSEKVSHEECLKIKEQEEEEKDD